MKENSHPSTALYVLAVLAFPLAANAQEIRVGSEFQVNSFTNSSQSAPAVAMSASGDFVVAWQSDNSQDGFNVGVFARRFSSAGVALASEFQVNSFTNSSQSAPAVAMSASGDFVVAWQSDNGQDGFNVGVFARRFSSAGVALASEFQANSFTNSSQSAPAVATDSDGDFVVAWQSDNSQDGFGVGIFARQFSSAGTALASEFQVNSFTNSSQSAPAVATDSDGDFVVAWQSDNSQDGFGVGIFARQFSSAGVALASEFQANSFTNSSQSAPAVATDSDGDFVVAWQSDNSQDGFNIGVFARRFSSAGVALASEFQANSFTNSSQSAPAVATDSDGDFVVAWQSDNSQDGFGVGVFARRFSSAGVALASEFQANSFTNSSQSAPAVAAAAAGGFVVAWQSDNSQDGFGIGIFAQRFAAVVIMDIDGNGSAQPLTDGLLSLRYLFGFRGATLITGAVDLDGCTRCDAAAIETYLAGLTGF